LENIMGAVQNIVRSTPKWLGADPFDLTGTKAIDKEKKGRVAAGAAADAAAIQAQKDAEAVAKATAEDKAATAKKNEQTMATNKDESRRAALSDLLAGEGDPNQRRRYLKGAK
jgi:hypothetical protein